MKETTLFRECGCGHQLLDEPYEPIPSSASLPIPSRCSYYELHGSGGGGAVHHATRSLATCAVRLGGT